MDFFTNNLAESVFIVGLILLIIEVAVLGFSTFVLFFVGLAAMLTGALLYVSIIPDSVLSAMFSMGILTVALAILLWRPLLRMQSQVSSKKAQGDLVGHRFILQEAVTPTKKVMYQYSGVTWELICSSPMDAGTKVEVIEAEVGAFHIKAVDALAK